MKKLTLLVLLVGLIGFTSNATAQNMKGDFALGLGISYGADLVDGGEIGININSNYSFTNEIRASLDINYWLPGDDFDNATLLDVNINAHYLFVNDMNLRLYGLAGIHYASFEYDFGGFSVSSSETGFNVGAGIEYDLGGVLLFAEPKYTVNGWEQFAVTAGFRFSF
jgi:opacity protein-like surface antigen